MKKHYLEKTLLDLKYQNLLNWRSITFGLYFALIAAIGSYLSTFYHDLILFMFSLLLISFAVWIFIDEMKYSEIRDQLNLIERKISKLK